MTSFRFSLQAQLALFIGAFLAIVLGLAVLSTQSLRSVDAKTDALASKWIEGTRLLGELSDRISEFRIAETYRALADSDEDRIAAEQRAATNRLVIEQLQRDYFALFGAEPRPDLAKLRDALAAYLAAHDAWMKREPDLASIQAARSVSALHAAYKAADDAADAAIDELKWSAGAEAETAGRITRGAIDITLLAASLGIALAIWLLFRVKERITRPLAAITEALAQLAAGNRHVEVPEIERDDEIGAMAKSFDVFRANAQALERAHEATRAAQEHAQILARQDLLTGLPNRRMMVADLHAAIERVEDGATACALLSVDLDRFKPINDLEGHRIGDAVLCEVARRLRLASRKNDIVARLGGDEFAILIEMTPATHLDQAMRVAGRALAAIAEPIEIGDRRIELSASVGVSLCPENGLDVGTLLRAADIAMYHAKRDGRGRFRFFEQSMDEELRRRAALESALKKAVAAGDIRPFYQPLVDLRDSRIYRIRGAVALDARQARIDSARRLHTARRADRRHRRSHLVGGAPRLPRVAALGRAGAAVGQCLADAAQGSAARVTLAGDARRGEIPALAPRCRDYRERAHRRCRHRPRDARRPAGRGRADSRSMISAPAIRASIICAPSISTR